MSFRHLDDEAEMKVICEGFGVRRTELEMIRTEPVSSSCYSQLVSESSSFSPHGVEKEGT